MSKPHILIIPPWFDISHQHHFAKSYHRWAQDLADRKEAQIGLLYGDFSSGYRPEKHYTLPTLNYNYLGVQQWGLPKVSLGWSLWEMSYLKAYRKYVYLYGRPTVIHGFSLLGLIAAATIHQWHHIPFTYTEVLGSFISGKVAKRLVRKAHKPAQRASLVCGISPQMVMSLEKSFNVSAKLIPLYIDQHIFHSKLQSEDPPRFISIGSPAMTKGMDVLIKAMAQVVKDLPDAHLTIVDNIPEQSWLESLITDYHLENHVAFTGVVPHGQIPDLIHKSHVLVSASREESLGFTMLEALSCGRPVVATRTPGSEYIVQKGMGEIVPQEDSEQLAKAMIRMYYDKDIYNPMEIHKAIQSRFGKDEILDEWMGAYKEFSQEDSTIKRVFGKYRI